MKSKPALTVVVPVFNGAARLKELFSRTRSVLSEMNLDGEIIFVDDGSSDSSWNVIRELKTDAADCVRGFRLARNSGQQAATFCGLEHANGAWIVTLDDDLQSLPEEIPKLIGKAESHHSDVVYGVNPAPKHRFLHNLGTRIFRLLLRRLAPNVPPASSFRLINAEILKSLPQRRGPWVFVDLSLAWLTSDISTVVVEHEKRRDGKSGYSFLKLIGMALAVLAFYSTLPLQLMIWFGLLSAVASFFLGLYYLMLKLTASVPVGFSALIVTMTFTSGVIMMSLGILGMYVSKIYIMAIRQPAFIVRTEI